MTTEQWGDPEPTPQRRIAFLPFVIVALVVIAAVGFGLVVMGLAGARPPAPEPPAAAVSSAPAPTATPESRERPPAGPNECVDGRGDGQLIDIDSVALARDGELLRVVFVLADPLPAGTASLGVSARSEAVSYELVSRWEDGEINELYTVRTDNRDDHDDKRDDDGGEDRDTSDHGGPDQKRDDLNLRNVTADGSVIVAYFPKDVLRRLGDTFPWSAYAQAADEVVDSCPGGVAADGDVQFVD